MSGAGLGVEELDPGPGHRGSIGVEHASGHAGRCDSLGQGRGRVDAKTHRAHDEACQCSADKATQGDPPHVG